MNHKKMQEKILSFDDPETSVQERQEITAHLEHCALCRDLLDRWRGIHTALVSARPLTSSQHFVEKVMRRLSDLEMEAKRPAPAKPPAIGWLYPVLGYSFALLLMFAAIAHWEPYLYGRNGAPSTENVLLSSVPQSEQFFFVKEPPEINYLFELS